MRILITLTSGQVASYTDVCSARYNHSGSLALVGDSPIAGGLGHLGDRLVRLRRLADMTQEGLAQRSGVSVDVIRKLEQHRKHSARLPTLHKLAAGLGVELTGLLGDPPALSSVQAESPALVAVRRAIMPSRLATTPESDGAEPLSLDLLKAEIAEGWTLYHAAEFGPLTQALPGIIEDARLAVAVWRGEQRRGAHAALGKALQLGGHLAIRLGKTDLPLSSLERALLAADSAEDPLLAPMVSKSVAWAYQRQNRWVTRSSSPFMLLMASKGTPPEPLMSSGCGAVC